MRRTSLVASTAFIVLLAATAAVGAPGPGPGRFEFVVLRPTSSWSGQWELTTSAAFDSVGVLFTLADIENWLRATGEIRLTEPAAERIASLTWWREIEKGAGWKRFEFRVDGVPICAGRMRSALSSSHPPPGLVILIQTFWLKDRRTVSFGFHRGSDRANLVDEPEPGCEDDARLLAVLREAGVLSD